LGKSVPDSEIPNKVNGLYEIGNLQLKLAASSFYTPRRNLMKNLFVKVLILGALLLSTTAALPMTQAPFDGPVPYPCIPKVNCTLAALPMTQAPFDGPLPYPCIPGVNCN